MNMIRNEVAILFGGTRNGETRVLEYSEGEKL